MFAFKLTLVVLFSAFIFYRMLTHQRRQQELRDKEFLAVLEAIDIRHKKSPSRVEGPGV